MSEDYQKQDTSREMSINNDIEKQKGRSLAQSKPRDLTQEKIAESFTENFKTWYKECMSQTNTYTEADERLIKILKKQILKNNPFRIVFIIFLIFSPILITGIYSFVTTKQIVGCTSDREGNMQLSQCIQCNQQSAYISINLFWMIIIYILWSINILYYIFLYYHFRNYAATITLLLTYNIRTKGTMIQAYKQNIWQIIFFLLLTVFVIFCTYFVRDGVEKSSNENNCTISTISDKPVNLGYKMAYTLEGMYINGMQYAFALAITGFYVWIATDRLMTMQRDSLSEFFDYNIFFHTHFDQEIEYLTHQLNDTKFEATINEVMDEFNKVQYESGIKKPYLLFDEVLSETIIMMVANNLRRDKTCKIRKAKQ